METQIAYVKNPYMSGSIVETIQEGLIAAGFFVINDGIYGPVTE